MARFALLVLLLAVAGCSHSTPRHAIEAPTRPPAPMVEVIPDNAASNVVWINGYWGYDGYEYVWVRGHWATRPYDDWMWSPSGWVVVDGRYRFVAGTWVPASRPRRVVYVHSVPTYRRGPVYQAVPRRGAPGRRRR